MVSLFALASRPQRLQLVALVLVLGAGLLPERFVGAEEAPVVDEAEGATPAEPDGSSNSSSTAVGRTSASAAPAGARCYVQDECNGPRTKCMLKGESLNKTKCEGAYCYQRIEETGAGQVLVYRACATREEVFCLSREPNGCLILCDKNERNNVKQCMQAAARAARHGRQSRSQITLNFAPEDRDLNVDASGKAERCVCETDLCNIRDSISSGPVGVKHLGGNVALLGVSLMANFPLRSVYRVG